MSSKSGSHGLNYSPIRMPLMPKGDPMELKDMSFSNSYDHIGHSNGEPWRQGHFLKV